MMTAFSAVRWLAFWFTMTVTTTARVWIDMFDGGDFTMSKLFFSILNTVFLFMSSYYMFKYMWFAVSALVVMTKNAKALITPSQDNGNES